MITIEIKNAAELIETEKGKFVSMMSRFLDFELLVERKVVKEIENSFREKGIVADIRIQ